MVPLVLWFVALVAAVQTPPHPTPQRPASVFGQGPSAEAGHRSQIRIRDPFVLPDRHARVYYVYGSTTRGLSPTDARREVVVYRTTDLENWGEPVTAWAVPSTHRGQRRYGRPRCTGTRAATISS